MFDPTIYDNLRVVLEGALYDLDEQGRLAVTGREDLVDLATMSRTFRMAVEQPEGASRAIVELSSGLLDFAGELRQLRLANEVPGCTLDLVFLLPVLLADLWQTLDQTLQDVWGETADIIHERVSVLGAGDVGGHYRIIMRFRGKIDEDNMDDIEPLLEHVVSTLEHLEQQYQQQTGNSQ